MNSRKSKTRKRKINRLESSSEEDSSKKDEDLDSESEEKSSEDEDKNPDESFSESQSSSSSIRQPKRRSKSSRQVLSSESSDSGEDQQDENADESSSEASDSSSDESQSSTASNLRPVGRSKASRPSVLSSDSYESGDETCEKCAICLRSIVNQEVGNPEVCDHIFCSVCIIEWSKNSNVCPLDRQQFSIILVRQNKNGNVVKKVPVQESQATTQDNVQFEEPDDTVCEICGSGDREDIMLLCDICDRGFHTICLTPPLENIPDENEWFCPDCDNGRGDSNGNEDAFDNIVSSRGRSLRRRVNLVRTRLLQRIRVTVNRIVENYVLQNPDGVETDDEYVSESDYTSESDFIASDDEEEPTTSGLQTTPKERKSKPKTRRRKTKSRKRTRKTSKRGTTRRKRKTTSSKQTSGTVKRRTKKRKTRVRTTRTKKVKVENADGTITEKIVKTRTYKRRKQKRKKRKVKTLGAVKRGLRVKSEKTPKTVKGRLALTLGMVPPKKPGQLLPDVKIRPTNSHMTSIDLNRARAGIPKLHIFGPRDELQYYSSESEHEDIIISGSGGVATVAQQRTNFSRIRDRKKAALALQSMPPAAPKTKPVIEQPTSEYVDILGSIMDSQAVWHSKNTNVKIKEDGSIEVIKDKDSNKIPKPENNKNIDVREGTTEGMTTQAPMYPGSGSRPGGFRPYNRNSYGDSRGGQDNVFSPRSGQTGVNFNRFGGPARNDREGYTNYLNNMPQGPTPFCRGGPPLRFRMPPRQQLRRIPFPPRNRPLWQAEEEEDENANEKDEKKENEVNSQTETKKPEEDDEDVDLYSDIEGNPDKTENSETEDGTSSYPALGPPPEPSAFLLGLEEDNDLGVTENKDKSEVYDPAEPCDSDDEMVIDENQKRSPTPEKKEETEPKKSPKSVSEPPSELQKASSDDDDEDCPIFSLYSSATREFSQKEEEERQREIAEDRKKLEQLRVQEEQKKIDCEKSPEVSERKDEAKAEIPKDSENEKLVSLKEDNEEKPKPERQEEKSEENLEEEKPEQEDNLKDPENIGQKDDKKKEKSKENVGSRLSFDYKDEDKSMSQEESSRSPSAKSARESSRSPSKSVDDIKEKERSPSSESDKDKKLKSPCSVRDKSSSPERSDEKYKRTKRKSKSYDSDYEEAKNVEKYEKSDDDKENEEGETVTIRNAEDREKLEGGAESETETVSQKIATGLEGLDVEEVSSDNGEGDEFDDGRSLSSLSLSELSQRSKRSKSPIQTKKKKKKKKKKVGKAKVGKNYEEGEIDDSEKDKRLDESYEASKNCNEEVGNENSPKSGEKRRRKSLSTESDRQILASKENKKLTKDKSKDKDLSWKKPSKKEKNYREGKKRSKERARSKSRDRRKSRSLSPKKDKKKNKDRKKKTDKKKDIERYDVRKIVKNKEVRKTDAFGRDILSKSRSISKSRSRTPVRGRSRNMLRRDSRSYSRSRSRSFRRGRSPIRRRYLRSRTRSRSKSLRRSYSRSRSRSRSRKSKKKLKSKDRVKARSRSRGRKSRSLSRGRRRSFSRSRSRSPVPRMMRSKKVTRSRRSWSHHMSRSPSFSPRRSRSITRSPIRMRRSYSRSISTSWSRGRSPLPRASSLEKLTVVLTAKDKKKWKKKKDGKKRKEEKRRRKTGNSKEVFASGDNVLVSVNFRNNTTGNNSIINNESRNTLMNSLSPVPGTETSRKKKRGSDYENERVTKKAKKANPISKKVVDVALSNACPKRAKKLTRLSEKDAEVILNRKPVAVIDLDMSPYREQTPSPVNVVVVSDSGSGDEGKEHTPQRQAVRGTPGIEVEKISEAVGGQSVTVSAPSSPVENGYVPTSGPKTPPEPQIKFSISKPQQLRQIANPLGDDDDEEEGDEDEGEQRMESLDRRIEKELDPRNEVSHKGPNTPPAPRGPSTPKTPPSPQSSPDAYDPFEPTKSRSPSPGQADKENRPSPKSSEKDDQVVGSGQGDGLGVIVSSSVVDETDKVNDVILENHDDKSENTEKGEAIPVLECSSNVVIPNQGSSAPVTDITVNKSPERNITVVITAPQNKSQAPTAQKTYPPVLKQLPMVSSSNAAPPTSVNLAVSSNIFSMPSPTKTSRSNTTTTQSVQMTGIQRLQHRLGSPVNRTPNSVKSTPEKRSTPRTETKEIFSTGNYKVRNVSKRNGEQPKQPRPLQDATNETIDITMDMDDSPYSPASSEGDDLFDPPMEPTKPSQSNSKPAASYKSAPKPVHRSPVKQLSKFDLLFGPTGPNLSPLKVGNKKSNAKLNAKAPVMPKILPSKTQKKGTSKKIVMPKMDEDQLKILDDLPSSAVELQVKDKFLKKLNRQERVVDEVKTVLKPHYARKHITKEEYKDILRRSVPKICHSRSGEINPSKIQSLIEAYVRKFRHAKKKGVNVVSKSKVKTSMFS